MSDPEEQVRALAGEAAGGTDADATGWFEQLYDLAGRGEAVVPWDRGVPHPLLSDWVLATQPDGGGRSAVVVGCGFGADAELLASRGFDTTAFDVSASAVEGARRRHPESAVSYVTADLLDLPTPWWRSFDLVVEIMTVQALPRRMRAAATAGVRDLVAPGGQLIVIASALRPHDDPEDGPPWPLTRAEAAAFAADGLAVVEVEERFAPPDILRWWGRFSRP